MAAEIRITINATATGNAAEKVKQDVAGIGTAAEKAGGGFSALKEVAVGALREIGAMGVGAVIDGFKALGGAVMDGIADAREAAKINAQTAQVIKSTGQAAGVSAEHVQDYAASLSAAAGKSLFGDSQIQESTNLLLTFTNIKGTVLDAATAISVDMAQALGGEPKDAAIQLGKALNDPIKGITALTRVGVTFSDEQKAMIQTMVEAGDTAGAQAVILEELNKEFGGSAEAAAAADGGWAQFNDRLGEAKETIGAAILPLLSVLVGFLNDTVMPAVEAAATAFSEWLADPAVQVGIQQLVAAIRDGLGAAMTFIGTVVIPALKQAIQTLFPIIAAAIAIFGQAGDASNELGGVLQQVGMIWTAYRALVEAEINAVWAILQAVLGQIMIFWQAHGTEIMAFAQTTWDTIVSIVMLAIELLQATIIPALQYIAAFISAHSAEIQAILDVAWNTIKVIITTVLGVIKGILTAALALIKGDWQGAWDAIKGIANTVWEAIKALFQLNLNLISILFKSTWENIKMFFQGILDGMVGWVIQTFQGIINAINDFLGTARSAAGGVADAIVDGIASGISSGAGKIVSAAKDAAMAALDAAMDALGISSPSKVFAERIGKPMAEGMAMGLAGGSPMVAGAGAYAAGAAVAGASTYNQQRSLTYAPTINTTAHSEALDMSMAISLAGV